MGRLAGFGLSWGGFLHLVKVQPAFGFALGLVINGFLGDDALFRQGFFSRFQLIRPFSAF